MTLQILNSRRIVVTGDRVRVFRYHGKEHRVLPDFPLPGRPRAEEGDKEDCNVYRARQGCKLLLEANAKPGFKRELPDGTVKKRNGPTWFLSCTFEREVCSYDEAVAAWRRFARKLPGYFGKDCGYVCVPEIQSKRRKKTGVGVWHFHAVVCHAEKFLNFSEVNPRVLSAWRKAARAGGSVDWSNVYSQKGISNYVSKYITKEMCGDIPFGRMSYLRSKNLKKPIVMGDDDINGYLVERGRQIDHIKSRMPDFVKRYEMKDGRVCDMGIFWKGNIAEAIKTLDEMHL